MFVRVYAHYGIKGKEVEAKAFLNSFAQEVKRSPDAIEIYKLVSEKDSTKLTTVTVWKSKEAWQKWNDARKAQATQSGSDSHNLWVKVEGDNYNSF